MSASAVVKLGLFDRLRPICVQLTKEHTRENVSAVFQAVNGLERKYMQELQEYVLFPLRIILKQEKKYSGELYVDIYQCMECVLSNSCVTRWDMFLDIFTTACMALSDPTDPSKLSLISEELKLAIVQMLVSLLKSSDFNVIENLFAVGSLPVLGHAVSILLNIADQERSRPLKIAALGFLMELCQEDRNYCTSMRVRLGDTLASFLPGVTITLSRIISCDTHQGQAVIQTALELLTNFMLLVLDDKLVAESQSKVKHQGHSAHASSKLESLVVHRNSEWLKATGSKLTVIVKQVIKVRSHSSWKVRLSLVNWVGTMLLHCRGSLEESISDLLTVLVGRLGDDYPKVATQSRQGLDKFAASLDGKQCRPLVEMLEDNLYNLSISLPRQMNTTDEEEKLFVVQLLVGYLELLGDEIDGLMLTNGRRLLMSLVQVLEMDYTDVRLVEERTTITGLGSSTLNQDSRPTSNVLPLRKYFKHFHDNRVFKKLQRACRCLGQYGNTQLLVDQVLDIAHLSAAYKPQAILMLNEIVMGTADKNITQKPSSFRDGPDDCLESIIRMLVEEYLSPGNFYLVTTATAESGIPHHQGTGRKLRAITLGSTEESVGGVYHRNTVLICLLLEGLGIFAKVLRKSYLPLMVQTLYPMLEKLGDDTAVISNTAYLSLCTTCAACNYSSIEELIQINADYLVNAISLRLRHFHDNQRSPLVLRVMLQYSNCDLLPLIDDTIQEILDVLDDHHLSQAVLFMGVLHELTKAIVRWFPPIKCEVTAKNCQSRSDKEENLCEGEDGGSLLVCIQHYCKQKRLASGEIEEGEIPEGDITEDDIIDETDTTEEDPKGDHSKPNTIKFVKQVMMRCKHLLPSHNARLRLLVLDTISEACNALADQTNELLPLLHEIWTPFSARFVDEEKLVIKKALEVLSVMARTSGDFLKQRVLKDVIPVVTKFLKKQAQISSQAGQAYLYTVNCRLQQQALQVLTSLAVQLDLAGSSLDTILCVCVSYLSSRQPKPLQQVSMEMCKQLADIGGDVLWLRLCDLYRDQEYTPPHPIFSSVQFRCKVGCQNEFSDNIMKLRSSGNCQGT